MEQLGKGGLTVEQRQSWVGKTRKDKTMAKRPSVAKEAAREKESVKVEKAEIAKPKTKGGKK